MKIAIKGIIGSGKSTLAYYLNKNYGFKIIEADEIVKRLYKTDNDLINKINNHFDLSGSEVNKKELASIVFSDKEKLKELEEIVHPVLENEISTLSNRVKDSVIDCQVIDKLNINYDYVIIATCDEEEIINRIKKRDNRSETQIKEIINLQKTHYLLNEKTFSIDTHNDDIEEQLTKCMKVFLDDYNR